MCNSLQPKKSKLLNYLKSYYGNCNSYSNVIYYGNGYRYSYSNCNALHIIVIYEINYNEHIENKISYETLTE